MNGNTFFNWLGEHVMDGPPGCEPEEQPLWHFLPLLQCLCRELLTRKFQNKLCQDIHWKRRPPKTPCHINPMSQHCHWFQWMKPPVNLRIVPYFAQATLIGMIVLKIVARPFNLCKKSREGQEREGIVNELKKLSN